MAGGLHHEGAETEASVEACYGKQFLFSNVSKTKNGGNGKVGKLHIVIVEPCSKNFME